VVSESPSYEQFLTSRLPHPIHSEHEADRVREEIQALVRVYPRADFFTPPLRCSSPKSEVEHGPHSCTCQSCLTRA
jgi:hypothetical protein